jgi:lantibiotic leader peptide-processing serine protease
VRRAVIASALAIGALMTAAFAIATPSGPSSRTSGSPTQYVVVYEAGMSKATARNAIRAAGGTLVRENKAVGVATVVSRNPNFITEAASTRALFGAVRNRPLGKLPAVVRQKVTVEQQSALRKLTARLKRTGGGLRYAHNGGSRPEPLAGLQWDMQQIHATVDGSYRKEKGDPDVLVGILDTGVDGNHPDIKENFNFKLSRNFTVDDPVVDGPCADERDHSCNDASDIDENGHGTHVASTIGSPINKLGMAGVAPDVTIVNLRAGQDSGYFFLQPSVDALTYAGDHGIDVVNMSYYIDPWRYNCAANAADSPAAQLEQQTIMEATQRALDYANAHNVTLINSAGNEHEDLGYPAVDTTSPDYPSPAAAYSRNVDNHCLVLPTEGNNVMSISAIGPSKRKADYSNFGLEQTTVAAPGGFFRDDPLWKATDPPAVRNVAGIPNQILAAFPKNVAEDAGVLNPDGTPNTPSVVRDCRGSTCAYYQWIQGTSMASPHAVGVAALIVSRFGEEKHSKVSLNPLITQAILQATATDTPCPEPRLHSYADKLRPASFNALCEGTPELNGFYGHGIIDALGAVTQDMHLDD